MIEVLYAAEKAWSAEVLRTNLSLLPVSMQIKISAYADKEVQQRRITARLMLGKLINELLPQGPDLSSVKYSVYNKAYIEAEFYFSTTYTNGLVICAASTFGEIGIDAEENTGVDISLFEEFMTTEEWLILQQSDFNPSLFFSFWTRKEAVLKAIGRGIFEEFTNLEILKNTIILAGQNYFIQEIQLDKRYSISLASVKQENFKLRQFNSSSV